MTFSRYKWGALSIITTLLLTGCLSIKEKEALKEAERQRLIQEEIKSFGPPVVIYRIDDHRFFTLEEYNHRREGKTYYNNTQKGIHQKILHGSGCLYRGRLIWASTRDDALVFPAVLSRKNDRCAGTKYGCINQILVSLDGGENQRAANTNFGITSDSPEYESSRFEIIVINSGFYLGERLKSTDEAPFWWQKIKFDSAKPDYIYKEGKETPSAQLKTPSGQIRMDCSNPAIFDVSK
ncbi:T6SS immunity protein Tli3 family protein [Providencia stuartii]|uniref:T6SS immunity protein Tli3 family protein n=1 Tax=Providencia stuartii TaxID=588 RepID=UPI00331CB8BB